MIYLMYSAIIAIIAIIVWQALSEWNIRRDQSNKPMERRNNDHH